MTKDQLTPEKRQAISEALYDLKNIEVDLKLLESGKSMEIAMVASSHFLLEDIESFRGMVIKSLKKKEQEMKYVLLKEINGKRKQNRIQL